MEELNNTDALTNDLAIRLAYASGAVKLVTGVFNNAAWLVCLDALSEARKHPNFKHKAKRAYNRVIEEYKAYERRLKHSDKKPFFVVSNLVEKDKSMFGDISDSDYYDAWVAHGSKMYVELRQELHELALIYKESLDAHNVPHSDIMSLQMVAQSCLLHAVSGYLAVVDKTISFHKLPNRFTKDLFCDFNIKRIADAWFRAMCSLEPKSEFEMTDDEKKRIVEVLKRFMHKFLNPDLVHDSAIYVTEEYGEIFASKEEQEKAIERQKERKKINV